MKAKSYGDFIKEETLAEDIVLSDDTQTQVDINGHDTGLKLEKVN